MGKLATLKRRSTVLLIGLASAAMLASTLTNAAAAHPATVLIRDNLGGSDATVGLPGVQWPTYEKNSTVEPSIGVDPNNPLDAVAAYHSGRDPNGGAADIGFATTKDAGHTWVHGNLPGLTTHVNPTSLYNHASDPVVAFGPNHIVYVNSLVIQEDSSGGVSAGALAVNTSLDGGTTWEPNPVFMHVDNPSIVANVGFFDDKNWITVDMGTGVGHHFGRVYVVWDIQQVILYAYCDPDNPAALTPGCDQLNNWSVTPDQATVGTISGFGVAYNAPGIGSYPLVLQNGNLEIVYNDEGAAFSQVSSAPNFAEVTTVTPAGAVPWPSLLTFPTVETVIAPADSNAVRLQRAGPDLPTAAIDPLSGRVAVGWAGGAHRTDGVNDAEVAVSTDATGATFGAPIRVNTGAANDYVDRYNTAIGFGSDGSLRVAYRQRQEAADSNAMSPIIDTFYQVSYDFGATWSTPLQIDTQNTNVGFCAFSRGGCFEGDYDQLAPAGPNTYIVRQEAYAPFPGAPPNNSNNTFNNDIGNINQHAWVALVGPVPSTDTPEAPLVVALTVVGTGATAAVVALRRRRGTPASQLST